VKSFKEHLSEAKVKSAVFTFGRFNPITKGHGELIDFVVRKSGRGDAMIFTSQSNDAKKNPIPYKDKLKFLKKFFPKANIMDEPKLKTPFQILEWLSDNGYRDVTMVVGGDRVAEFEKRIRPYVDQKDPNKPHYDFDKFKVVNSGERKEGVSGTDMRNHAKNDDFDAFKAGMPKGVSDSDAKAVFKTVKKGMKLK
jgi:hypothetical protein